ncbi:MAG: hypothetical protein CL608_29045 [Anaerolineaceae bacterium]|nr:hypothetical protein [Anaerolineaceae bacterium]
MKPDIIQVQYDKLQNIAQQFGQQADAIAALNQKVRNQAENLQTQWVGQGSTTFFREMETVVYPAGNRLTDALADAQRVTLDICAVMQQAEEEAAAPFRGGAVNGPEAGGPTGHDSRAASGGLWRKILDVAGNIVDAVGTAVPASMALIVAASLKMGSTYPGQVLVSVPDWVKMLGINKRWVKGMAGLSENLTHIKASNMAAHLGKFSKKLPLISGIIAAAQGAIAVANVWTENWEEYGTYNNPRKITAMGVDAAISLTPSVGEAAGGMAGAVGGAKLGAVLGSMVAPGIGTAVGTVIGGAFGAIAGSMAGDAAGTAAKSSMIDAGWRDKAIDTIDKNIAQPVANKINDAIDTVRNLEMPQFSLPELNFGF